MTDATYSQIQFKVQDGIAALILHRPERRNAITTVMLAEMIHAVECCADDTDIRVLVLQGAHPGFCPGDDLSGMGPLPDDFEFAPSAPVTHAALQASLRNLPKPTIAAIHGYAFGVGLDLAMACDFRIAMEDAVLRDQRVMERGMHAVTGCAWFHPRAMGLTRALEFLIMGEPLSGREAAELGMVNRATTAGEFGAEVERWAEKLASAPTRAIGLMKRQVYTGLHMDHAEFMAFAAPLINEVEIKDREEGIRAFLEKRAANFTGE